MSAVIYAPQGEVDLRNQTSFTGAVAASKVVMQEQATLTYDTTAGTVKGGAGGSTPYAQTQYLECTPSQDPTAGCP